MQSIITVMPWNYRNKIKNNEVNRKEKLYEKINVISSGRSSMYKYGSNRNGR